MAENVLIVHGGGPTAVINSSLYGVIEEAKKIGKIDKVYAAIGGSEGILKERFLNLLEFPEEKLKLLLETPATAIGSSRYALEQEDYEAMVGILKKHEIKYVLLNGGNGTMDTCGRIYEVCKDEDIRVVGIPKTIDNDIAITDHTPGFGSAARYIAATTAEVGVDVKSLPIHVCIIEAMGRNAGWITAASALARKKPGDAPHLIYLPERPFNEAEFLEDVKRLHEEKGGVVVVVSEGLKNEAGEPIVPPIFKTERATYYGDVSAYLAELADNTFSLTSWERHVDIVKRQSILRELVFAATQINALAYDAPDDLDQVVEEAEKTLFNVTEKRVSSSFRKMDELVSDAYEEISRLANQKDKMAGVPTGFKDVDELFHGFRGGDLVILAARPGVGKTSFALNLATNAAKAGAAVAFFSLEMGAEQLVQRILCSEARVNLSKLRSGFMAEGDWGALAEASGKLSQLDMFIDDTPALTTLELRARARRLKAEKGLGLVIVDYLQLMRTSRRTDSRELEISDISRSLKGLAKEMNVPVVALSQLNRKVEERGDKRPMLSDLRESGAIEQDADVIMFVYRDDVYKFPKPADRPVQGIAEIIIGKQRNGPVGVAELLYMSPYTAFEDLAPDWAPSETPQ